ncbi:MAG: hypothetical protein WCD76_09410, partial [Pyrinomonadaceae bacterium]
RLATELGFKVPRFIVTNDVDRAAAFLDSNPRGTIIKVLGAPTIYNNERAAAFYTHLVTEKDREQLYSVRFGPTFLQEFVVKTMDVRVTVIGDKLFAVGIDATQSEDAHVDFRLAEVFDLPHRCLKLPRSIEDACFELVRKLDLKFGAIDLLLTADGEYIFLEINPNGQWLWIEWITGMPMTKAMCDLLSLRAGD